MDFPKGYMSWDAALLGVGTLGLGNLGCSCLTIVPEPCFRSLCDISGAQSIFLYRFDKEPSARPM